MDLTGRFELQHVEQRLEALLDDKLSEFNQKFAQQQHQASSQTFNPQTEAMINEVVSLFRTQLQESATRGLEESQMDARGELDFELLRDLIQQGHAEAQALLQRELADIFEHVCLRMWGCSIYSRRCYFQPC